jgi:hypothetical protein
LLLGATKSNSIKSNLPMLTVPTALNPSQEQGWAHLGKGFLRQRKVLKTPACPYSKTISHGSKAKNSSVLPLLNFGSLSLEQLTSPENVSCKFGRVLTQSFAFTEISLRTRSNKKISFIQNNIPQPPRAIPSEAWQSHDGTRPTKISS